VIVLEDNDVLHIVGGGYGIYNTAQTDVETAVPRRLQLLEVEVDQIMKVCLKRGRQDRAAMPDWPHRCMCTAGRGAHCKLLRGWTRAPSSSALSACACVCACACGAVRPLCRVATTTTCSKRSTSSPTRCSQPCGVASRRSCSR
jgi:hypothetical protein